MSSFKDEIRLAESHLNRDLPKPGTVALAVVAFVLLVITKAASANCSLPIKNVQFSGTFSLKSSPQKKPLRFVIGEPAGAGSGSSVAQIWSGDRCQATCSSIDIEKGEMALPISLDLQCRGEDLGGALSAHVAVLWDHGADHTTVLRFGSWLEGYEQAAMKVEVDHFNSPTAVSVASRSVPRLVPRKRKMLAFRAPGLEPPPIEH
jgi:hypothetical protein